ncbi:hypothetical protein K431DRAFT_286673 [Polychaeton citri CBS 116435]|uniref:Uncharacterized protein n=1 Tax=Polychaeton citri CBS 116435 TaxID=1314669 RepID=A0A9P4Q4V6_9PEZI|nr:hypothetical protein K431DRAFT_286673 [Polychaeton citri CBS 116435]
MRFTCHSLGKIEHPKQNPLLPPPLQLPMINTESHLQPASVQKKAAKSSKTFNSRSCSQPIPCKRKNKHDKTPISFRVPSICQSNQHAEVLVSPLPPKKQPATHALHRRGGASENRRAKKKKCCSSLHTACVILSAGAKLSFSVLLSKSDWIVQTETKLDKPSLISECRGKRGKNDEEAGKEGGIYPLPVLHELAG